MRSVTSRNIRLSSSWKGTAIKGKERFSGLLGTRKKFLAFCKKGKKFQICAGVLEQSMWARNRVGTALSYRPASLCSLAGQYDNPIPTRFLAHIDCSKIPALVQERQEAYKFELCKVGNKLISCRKRKGCHKLISTMWKEVLMYCTLSPLFFVTFKVKTCSCSILGNYNFFSVFLKG